MVVSAQIANTGDRNRKGDAIIIYSSSSPPRQRFTVSGPETESAGGYSTVQVLRSVLDLQLYSISLAHASTLIHHTIINIIVRLALFVVIPSKRPTAPLGVGDAPNSSS